MSVSYIYMPSSTLMSMPQHNLIPGAPSQDAKSWYVQTANDLKDREQLTSDISVDVCVVGGGFVGTNTAIECAKMGLTVALVEQHTVGWGASGRNGGQLVTGFNKSLSEVRKWVGPQDAQKLWDMQDEGKRIVAERIKEYSIECDYRSGYVYAAVKKSHEDELREMRDVWEQDYGYQGAEWLGKDALLEHVSCPSYRGGIFDHQNGHLHPLNYVRGLARAAEREGAKVFEFTKVTGIETAEASGAVKVRTQHGTITAGQVVLAGNAYMGHIDFRPYRSAKRQIVPVGTYIIATEKMGPDKASQIMPSDVAVSDVMFVVNYYRRSSDHRILFGGGLDWTNNRQHSIAARMTRDMMKWLPKTEGAEVEFVWGGYVDMTPTRLPMLSEVAPNVLCVHGFSGNGITLTGICGRIAAEAVAGKTGRFDVFARLPQTRFPGGDALHVPIAAAGALYYKLKDLLP